MGVGGDECEGATAAYGTSDWTGESTTFMRGIHQLRAAGFVGTPTAAALP